jgi:transcriptional regulator with XRE-family HTH domain
MLFAQRYFMGLLDRFGAGLQKARKSRGLTQEDFSVVSSRTYLSSLERGIKSPTITKIEELASVIGVHPLSLLALAYLPAKPEERNEVCARIKADIESFSSNAPKTTHS